MKKISIIIIYLLIAFSYEEPIALTDCEIKNDATTATKAVVSCLASATIANYVFVDDYLKLVGKTDNTKTASLSSCAKAACDSENSDNLFPCTVTCSKVTGEEKDVQYLLKAIGEAASSGVFSGEQSTAVITLALKASSTNYYTGQAGASAVDSTTDSTKTDATKTDSSSFIKYTLLLLNILLF